MRIWTPEARKQQSELIRRHRPWARSTGPRTAAGKAKSARNAYKHGGRAAPMKRMYKALSWQRQFVLAVMRRFRRNQAARRATRLHARRMQCKLRAIELLCRRANPCPPWIGWMPGGDKMTAVTGCFSLR